MARTTFCLCMIVRNEAANLPRGLGPIGNYFDEIVVVDTGSTDGTQDLARSYGARVFDFIWADDFAAARNASIQAAASDWILWLDADNAISPESVYDLRKNLDVEKRSIFWCTEVVVPDGERLIQKRVFPRRDDVFFAGRVHEQLIHPNDFSNRLTPVEIVHWGYADKTSAREKGLRNLRLLERMAMEQEPDLYLCYQMGRTLFNLRRFEESMNWLRRAIRTPQGREQNQALYRHAFILLAQALNRINQGDQAGAVLDELTRSEPDYGPGHFWRGRLKYAEGRYPEALEHFRRFLKCPSVEPIAGFNFSRMSFTATLLTGRSLEQLGRFDEAAEAYRIARRIDPQSLEPELSLARLALERGYGNEARSLIEDCLKRAPENPRALAMLKQAAIHA